MPNYLEYLLLRRQAVLTTILIARILFGIFPIWQLNTTLAETQTGEVSLSDPLALNSGKLALLEENSLIPLSGPSNPEPKVLQKVPVIITAYSSTSWETDNDPYLTAAGTQVQDGVVANNYFPFGTKIKVPEIFGDKVFTVEDRMNWKKSDYHIDIWFASYWDALNFGAKETYIEVL